MNYSEPVGVSKPSLELGVLLFDVLPLLEKDFLLKLTFFIPIGEGVGLN
jgi:hypothetical protein